MSMEVTPAIVRSFGEKDRQTEVISTPYDKVSHRRGWGDTGYKVEVVEHDCPACNFDRMVRRHNISPQMADEVRYFCLNPNCGHFVQDSLSYAMHGNYPQRHVKEPAVFEEADA